MTAASAWDIGPTSYYISIFNQTTGARLALCGLSSECVTGPGTGPPLNRCYSYVAFVGGSGVTMPPEPVQRTSDTVQLCNYLK
jgi:hypothetical protein